MSWRQPEFSRLKQKNTNTMKKLIVFLSFIFALSSVSAQVGHTSAGNYLIAFDRTIGQSVSVGLTAADYHVSNEVGTTGTDTVSYKDLEGVAYGDITTWIGTLSATTYNSIYVGVECDSNTASKLSTAQLYSLIAKLKSGSQGTVAAGDSVTNADTVGGTLIGDTGESWVTNEHEGKYVHIYGGTGSSQIAKIKTNSDTVLHIYGSWQTDPDATSDFRIIDSLEIHLLGHNDKDGVTAAGQAWKLFHPGTAYPMWIGWVSGDVFPYNGGLATAGKSDSIIDTNHNAYDYSSSFSSGGLTGYYVYTTSGTGAGQYRKITGNNSDTIFVASDWTTIPSTDTYYQITTSTYGIYMDQIVPLMNRTLFWDVDDATTLENWRRLTNWGKVRHGRWFPFEDSGSYAPPQDHNYIDELKEQGLLVFKYSLL